MTFKLSMHHSILTLCLLLAASFGWGSPEASTHIDQAIRILDTAREGEPGVGGAAARSYYDNLLEADQAVTDAAKETTNPKTRKSLKDASDLIEQARKETTSVSAAENLKAAQRILRSTKLITDKQTAFDNLTSEQTKSKPASADAAEAGWKTFQGAYFTVQVPAIFKTVPSQKSDGASAQGTYDSVFFRSPDESVEFYIYSPVRGTNSPPDIQYNPTTERMVNERVEPGPNVNAKSITIEARDGSYDRSIVEQRDTNYPNITVFGIKYKNENTRKKYSEIYKRFKHSLKVYTDH